MANLSSAYGTITFEGEYFDRHDTLIEDAFTQTVHDFKGNYGFTNFSYPAYNPSNDSQEYDFKGNGRWSFFSIQDKLFDPEWYSDVDKKAPWIQFLKTLHDEDAKVVLKYTDSEGANNVLYKAKAEYKGGKLIKTERHDYDWNLYNVHTLVNQSSPDEGIWYIKDSRTLSDALREAQETNAEFKQYVDVFNQMDEIEQDNVVEDIQNDSYLNGYIANFDLIALEVLAGLMDLQI